MLGDEDFGAGKFNRQCVSVCLDLVGELAVQVILIGLLSLETRLRKRLRVLPI